MPDLALYLNEHSLPPQNVTAGGLQPWSDAAKVWIEALRGVGRYHPKFRLCLQDGWLTTDVAGRLLKVWIKDWIGTEEFRRLLLRISTLECPDDLSREVRLHDDAAVGLTFAHLQRTWACSFPIANSEWLSHGVKATELSVDLHGAISESDCEIGHISSVDHIAYWSSSLTAWGQTVSTTSQIGVVAGYSILMYSAPSEHGTPHVHVVDGANRRTIAKYKIEPFELMEGKPKLYAEMRNWIAINKTPLLNSWDRCMHGGHPYTIASDDRN